MARFDSRGLPLSTECDHAAALYLDRVDLLLAAWPGAAEPLEAAIIADPALALAYAARARLHAIRAEPAEATARIAVVRIGGSGAQGEVVEDTLLVALMRSGEAARARALLDRRLHRGPSARDTRWHALLVA